MQNFIEFSWPNINFEKANMFFSRLKKNNVPPGLAMHKAAKHFNIEMKELARAIGNHSGFQVKLRNMFSQFVHLVAELRYPLLSEIFKQGTPSIEPGTLVITLPGQLIFMERALLDSGSVWEPILETTFGCEFDFVLRFDDNVKAEIKKT